MSNLKKNYPLHVDDHVYLYNTTTRQFLSTKTTEHLERLSGRREPFLQGTTDKKEAMLFRIARCQRVTRNSSKIYSKDEVAFYSLTPGVEGRFLKFSTVSASSGATFQDALNNGLVHRPRTFLTLGASDSQGVHHSGIYSLWPPSFAVDPLAPVTAYETMTILNNTADEPVLFPRDFNLAHYEIEPHHPSPLEAATKHGDYDKVAVGAQWILYPAHYYDLDTCQIPSVMRYVSPDGLDTHGNPVFRSAQLCREFKVRHPESLPATGFTVAAKGTRVPWWMTGNYTLDTKIPTDICFSERGHRLPDYSSAGECLAASLPPSPPVAAVSAPAPAPQTASSLVAPLVLGNAILLGLVLLVWASQPSQ